MNILLTNDDGWESEGLQLLREHLSRDHRVFTVVPDTDRSGCSHALTLKQPFRVRKFTEDIQICFGTPADCVFLAMHSVFDFQPDLVISGINPGPNLGTDIIYSGTAGAAREAVLQGKPGIALSVNSKKPPHDFDQVFRFLDEYTGFLVSSWDDSFFYNINFPARSSDEPDVKITRPSVRKYHDSLDPVECSSGDVYYFLKGEAILSDNEDDSDSTAVERGDISLTPVKIRPESAAPEWSEKGLISDKA
jgi:5'-nucleotidase